MRRARPNLRRYVQPVAAAPAAVVTPVTIMGANCIQWCRSDLGLTDDGSGNVLSWTDQVNGANSYAPPGAASTRPAITAAQWNGRTALTFDGTDDYLSCTLDLPLPGTTPTLIMMVLQALTFQNGDCFCDGDGAVNKMKIYQDTITPNVRSYAAVASNANTNLPTPGDARVLFAFFNNAITDYITIGSQTQTGVNTGNLAGAATTGRRLGRLGGASGSYANFRLYEVAYFDRDFTAGESLQMAAYLIDLYTAAVMA